MDAHWKQRKNVFWHMQIIRYSIWLAKSHWYICFIGATVTNSDIVEKTTLYIKCVTCTNAHTATLFGIQSINYYRMAIHRHSHILYFFYPIGVYQNTWNWSNQNELKIEIGFVAYKFRSMKGEMMTKTGESKNFYWICTWHL